MEINNSNRAAALTHPHEPQARMRAGRGMMSWTHPAVVALLVMILTVVLLIVTAPDIGLTWDEPVYITAAETYVDWPGQLVTNPRYALSDQGVNQYWELNHEHPPLDKLWSGLVWLLARHVFDDLTAHRLGNILLAGMLIALVYLQLALDYGLVPGLVAAGALLTMPRFFFHAHLAALDVPTAATIFAVTFLFWRTYNMTALRWSLWLGIAWGFALATKIDAVVVPMILFVWALGFHRQWYVFRRLLQMIVVGIVVWVILWPWLYHDSLHRIWEYLDFLTVHHYKISQWYLGHLYLPPPWHYPLVITLAVVPLTVVALLFLGSLCAVWPGPTRALSWLLVLSVGIVMVVVRRSAFDDERLFMPAFPYLAALAGLGFYRLASGIERLAQYLGSPGGARPLTLGLAVLIFTPQIVSAYGLYPDLLSYYSETVGGIPGATRLGLETTYWCETVDEALPYLNSYAPTGALVWTECQDVMLYYQVHGQLRRDLRVALRPGTVGVIKDVQGVPATIDVADYAVIEYRQSGFTPEVRNWLDNRQPLRVITYNTIPLMGIYTR